MNWRRLEFGTEVEAMSISDSETNIAIAHIESIEMIPSAIMPNSPKVLRTILHSPYLLLSPIVSQQYLAV
jgi:hypothetical protein